MRHPPVQTNATSLCMSNLAQITRIDDPPLRLPFKLKQGYCDIHETGHCSHLLELQTLSRRF